MNSGIIIKVEYRVFPASSFLTLTIIPYSGKFNEVLSRVKEGALYAWEGSFDIAKLTDTTDQLLDSIAQRKAQFRITDGNGTLHLVGTDQYPARMLYSRQVDNQPGAYNGYRCTILRKSPVQTYIAVQ